jgi:hypothetical protein
MPDELNPNDPRTLWQTQEAEQVTLTADEIRSLAKRFERKIYWRNMREYVAGAAVVAFFIPHLWRDHGWRLGQPVLMIVGALYVLFELWRRGSSRTVPADAGAAASLEFHRRELERQRDALHRVWLWYLLPCMPGIVAGTVQMGFDRGFNAGLFIYAALVALTFAGIAALNEWAARNLEKKIQALKAMETTDE